MLSLANKRMLIFYRKHPLSFRTTMSKARKSPLKKRNPPAAADLRLW